MHGTLVCRVSVRKWCSKMNGVWSLDYGGAVMEISTEYIPRYATATPWQTASSSPQCPLQAPLDSCCSTRMSHSTYPCTISSSSAMTQTILPLSLLSSVSTPSLTSYVNACKPYFLTHPWICFQVIRDLTTHIGRTGLESIILSGSLRRPLRDAINAFFQPAFTMPIRRLQGYLIF